MKQLLLSVLLSALWGMAFAQFPPAAGQPGTTAIYKDSAVFIGWATSCSVTRGFQDLSNKSLLYATAGDSSLALGVAGANGVVSLGDGGVAIVQFAKPIGNAPGWDFAVFENSFSDTFLELAYVEVSADGKNYFRFPCTSNTDTATQVDGFGDVNATKIDNLAGKYRALYGTPFDLEQLAGKEGLNINAVTHVKIIDAVGCIKDQYARRDQYGHKINEPWPTPFNNSGFDLDAVGVIHSSTSSVKTAVEQQNSLTVYPNPVNGTANIQFKPNQAGTTTVTLRDIRGIKIFEEIQISTAGWQNIQLNTTAIDAGIYLLEILREGAFLTKKIVVNHE